MEMWIRKRAPSGRVPLIRDDLPAFRLLKGVVVCGRLYLPRSELALRSDNPVVLTESCPKRSTARAWKRKGICVSSDPGVFGSDVVVAALDDLSVGDARQTNTTMVTHCPRPG